MKTIEQNGQVVGQLGIEETLDVLDFVEAAKKGYDQSMADGNHSWWEVANYSSAGFKLPGAINGIDKVWAETKDWDESEIEIIKNRIKSIYSMSDEELEAQWEEVFSDAINLVNSLIKLIDRKKTAA